MTNEENEGSIEAWEFDARRADLVDFLLLPGEALSWKEEDVRLLPSGLVRKEMRRGHGTVTFCATPEGEDRVLAVGTYYLNENRGPVDPVVVPGLKPGIANTVRWLRENGFDTCDSGDGVTAISGLDRDYPHVTILVTPETMVPEARRLQSLLETRIPSERWAVPEVYDGTLPPPVPTVQASFDPKDGVAILDLSYVDDRDLGLVEG